FGELAQHVGRVGLNPARGFEVFGGLVVAAHAYQERGDVRVAHELAARAREVAVGVVVLAETGLREREVVEDARVRGREPRRALPRARHPRALWSLSSAASMRAVVLSSTRTTGALSKRAASRSLMRAIFESSLPKRCATALKGALKILKKPPPFFFGALVCAPASAPDEATTLVSVSPSRPSPSTPQMAAALRARARAASNV